MKEKPGEIILLCWDGKPDAYYVKGHVPYNEAIYAVCDYEGFDPEKMKASHVWAKWCRVSEDDGFPEGVELSFRVQKKESRGWFKVTEVRKAMENGGEK